MRGSKGAGGLKSCVAVTASVFSVTGFAQGAADSAVVGAVPSAGANQGAIDWVVRTGSGVFPPAQLHGRLPAAVAPVKGYWRPLPTGGLHGCAA